MTDSMQLTLFNASKGKICLVHTEASNGDPQSTMQGERDRWLKPPPHANEAQSIDPGKSQEIGTIDYVSFIGSSHFHWLYYSYEDDPTAIVQIGVIQRPTAGVWVSIGPFDTNSEYDHDANTKFMPKGERPELIEYTDMTSIPARVTIHAPSPQSWRHVKKNPSPSIDLKASEHAQIAWKLIDGALSTLITTCFVVPEMLPGAVPLTFVQALLHMVNTPGSQEQIGKAFGAKDAFSAAKLANLEMNLDDLRVQMDNASSLYNADNGGISSIMTSIAMRIEVQQHGSGEIEFDNSLKADIKRCYELFKDIIDKNGPFQTSLIKCLNAQAVVSDTDAPSKIRLALGVAGICMTMNAYLHGFTLRSIILVEKNKWVPENTDIDNFSAENLLLYVSAKKGLIQNYNIESVATFQRLSYIICSIGSSSSISTPYSSTTWFAIIKDPGLTTALWGAGTVDAANEVMKNAGYTAVDKFKTGEVHQWGSNDRGQHIRRSSVLYKGYTAYAEHVKANVSKDVENVVTRAMNDLEDSAIPYMAHRHRPHRPSQAPVLREILYNTQPLTQAPELLFKYVRYGCALKNATGMVGDIMWQAWPPTELVCASGKDGERNVSFAPIGCKVRFEKDTWNKRAEELAAKAEKEAKTNTSASTPKIGPTYPTIARLLYRRLYKSLEKGDTPEAVADVEEIGMLLNNSQTDDLDDTDLKEKILP